MALIRCPECGKEVSDKAEYCQGCGFPISSAQNNQPASEENKILGSKKLVYGAIVVAVMIGIIILAKANGDKGSYYGKKSYSDDSYSSYSSKPKTGKEGALAKAETYLASAPFSYNGLIKQLEFEGFSAYEAEYAADNCGANWKEQAVREAKSYLDVSAFSYSGLIKQVEFSGYTSDEAEYGVDNCGANWKEQAVRMAASYLDLLNYSRSRLIEQLV